MQHVTPLLADNVVSADDGIYTTWRRRVVRTRLCGTHTKIGTIQRRLAWPLRKDDTQNREAFHIKKKRGKKKEEFDFIIKVSEKKLRQSSIALGIFTFFICPVFSFPDASL